MRVVVVTPPEPVVSLADAKAHLRVDHADEDALIGGLVAAATQSIDGPAGWLGRSIGVQTLDAFFSAYETCGAIRLPYRPVIELLEVAWFAYSGTLVDGDTADLELIGDDVWGGDTPPWTGMRVRGEALRIRYRAGYETIPAPIHAAILLMVGNLYADRQNAGDIPPAAAALLGPYRVFA